MLIFDSANFLETNFFFFFVNLMDCSLLPTERIRWSTALHYTRWYVFSAKASTRHQIYTQKTLISTVIKKKKSSASLVQGAVYSRFCWELNCKCEYLMS